MAVIVGDDAGERREDDCGRVAVKEPRTIARRYQLALCKKAMEENIIVYLETGCGKTHIAVLLMYELGHMIRKPQKSVCVFLAPTVHLVQQQAVVIDHSTNFKVGTYFGAQKHLDNHKEWESELEKYEVLVMTPEILLRNLHHCFMRMDTIALLIFDECHHAQKRHPYAQIMKEFYRHDDIKRPHIFGLTASPVIGKGGSHQMNYTKCINTLEHLLDAKVYTVEDKEELELLVPSPDVKIYFYDPAVESTCQCTLTLGKKLEEIKEQCIAIARTSTNILKDFQKKAGSVKRLHDGLLFCLENLGLYAATQAVRILQSGDSEDLAEIVEGQTSSCDTVTEIEGTQDGYDDNKIADVYLQRALSVLLDVTLLEDGDQPEAFLPEVLEEPFFSNKLLVLITILSSYRQDSIKCIVFVNRIITARLLAQIFGRLECAAFWKCDFLVGYHSGLKSMSRKKMHGIVDNFRSGKVNLLFATNVAEEGLDIQTCCLIIRFDLPSTVASYIQSRGRARMQESEYLLLVERNNIDELNLVNDFISGEKHMNNEILNRTSDETFDVVEDSIYKVEKTGASISSACSVSLLHHYCSRLPHDEYLNPVPEFFYLDDLDGVTCHVVLPSNAPIHSVEGPSCASKEDAKRAASLLACKKLYELGSLTDHLLPTPKEEIEIFSENPHDKLVNSRDDLSRAELHETVVPSALQVDWRGSASHLTFHFYHMNFVPKPRDRCYRRFGLFLALPLPKEAEDMKVDLHLSHGRIVETKLIPSGVISFSETERMEGGRFQEMCLKLMLDRSELRDNYVQLGKHDSCQLSSSTYYLMLPLKQVEDTDDRLTVDWGTVRNCLSSPTFNQERNILDQSLNGSSVLQLANGPVAESEILDSLVFTPHNGRFFFISDILHQMNGYSTFNDSKALNYAEYFLNKFDIVLKCPEQPLLKAKQLCSLHNLLYNRVDNSSEAREEEESFVELPPELCILKIKDFAKDIGSSLSLLPSLMHRLESLLVAIELKELLSASFPEGSQVTANRVLEALTTEKCLERFSLERLEILGDSFLKYAVSRHLFLSKEALNEGRLTDTRSSIVKNLNLYTLAVRRNLQVYIRDQCFNPCNFFAYGRLHTEMCDSDSEAKIHGRNENGEFEYRADSSAIKCSKSHQILFRKTIADVVEALVGAFIVDSGFKAALAFLEWMGIAVSFDPEDVHSAWPKSQRKSTQVDLVDCESLENLLSYKFRHKGLLVQAFTHPSSTGKHNGGCYQRLEFLGDAAVDYLIMSYLYSSYPNIKPGQLTDLRALTVNNNFFAHVAVRCSLHSYLINGSSALSELINKFVDFVQAPASERDLAHEPKCPKVLGDLVESCAGAILLDSGFDLNLVWETMMPILDPLMNLSSLKLNPVRTLRELCQSHKFQLSFPASKVEDVFSVQAKVNVRDTFLVGHGTNRNKKAAERQAAEEALKKLKDYGYSHMLKSLKKIAKSQGRQKPVLIGFDENPIPVDGSKILALKNSSPNEMCEPFDRCNTDMQTVNSDIQCKINPSVLSEADCHKVAKKIGDHAMQFKPAKSRLFELCSAQSWECPSYICYKDEGPSHMKLFTFKVSVQVLGATSTTLECFSEPKAKKKDAADHAAEGALWWLQHQG
ncbi:endoribonuclease Dicer homolog 4 isoform X3 [Nymphaea colorata]|uniref:endoribonuclease Dicer homolog 4 isoform X3 n=1 Tax=Nymphaea colorata TaxID=210225 RepID=UPI00129D27D2|nr:endoribonuclease Dicer homolog 4 isoform X3 [Nymphaea colorata]